MSTGAARLPHRLHHPRQWVIWAVVVLAGVAALVVGLDRTLLLHGVRGTWPPRPCVVEGVTARCGTFTVPEDRADPAGRTIGLSVVVVPATAEADPRIAFAYLAGGPGDAATTVALRNNWQASQIAAMRDLLLVDQRGTGGSKPHGGDVTRYGTRAAMDDLDAVRAALGYRQLDLFGTSYGATAAQVYARLHPSRVHTLALSGATALGVPFFARYAANAQRALDQLARACAEDAACRTAFPRWQQRFHELVQAWNAHPVHGMSGDELASVVHEMLRDVSTAVSIPLVVSRAANGDYGPLDNAGSGHLDIGRLGLMPASIWCSEPWVGLDATGPWGTEFDGYAKAFVAEFRSACRSVPRRAEPSSAWTLPSSSRIPVVALVGGADPQDPVANLPGLKRHFPDSRVVLLPRQGHDVTWDGGCDGMLATFVQRGTTKRLDATPCVGEVVVPPFELGES